MHTPNQNPIKDQTLKLTKYQMAELIKNLFNTLHPITNDIWSLAEFDTLLKLSHSEDLNDQNYYTLLKINMGYHQLIAMYESSTQVYAETLEYYITLAYNMHTDIDDLHNTGQKTSYHQDHIYRWLSAILTKFESY
jgi:hypothetical protein